MKAIHLRTAGLDCPLGTDLRAPLLTWHCDGGIRQRAYQVVAKDEAGQVVFDSGRKETGRMSCPYSGLPLRSRQIVTWRVCLWDEHNASAWSEESRFEMGLLEEADWQARWITGVGTDTPEHLPADCYSRHFRITRPVRKARLYATALGVYSAFVNGVCVSQVLSPGVTDYRKRLHYQTYDVTGCLAEGENHLEFRVADGWYKGHIGAEREDCVYGTQLKLLAQLEILYEDSSSETIGTDAAFRWSNDGPVRASDLGDGERYDARMQPSYTFSALEDKAEKRNLCASNAPFVSEHECLTPVLEMTPSGQRILNFGQNLAGYVRMRVRQPEGKAVCLRLFEAKDRGEYSDATLSFPNGQAPTVAQRIECVAGNKAFLFQPEFFYSGFQYALVEGPEEVDPRDFEAVAVYSGLEYTGDFACSNEMINQFVRNTVWSMKSNFIDIPTDCPQREKAGWTGDAQLFCRTAAWFADTGAFFRKWLKDVADSQREDGCVINVCPRQTHPGNRTEAMNGSVGWGDAAVIIPYTMWKVTGDEAFIRDNLDLMLRWKAYVGKICADKSLYAELPEGHPLKPLQPLLSAYLLPASPWNQYIPESGAHWGEWCVPASEEPAEEDPVISLIKPKQELTCAYTCYSMTMLAEMLEEIGQKEEAASCRTFADGSRQAYHTHWVKDGQVTSGHMAELVHPIALGLLTAEEARRTAENLHEMVVRRRFKVGTGFLSTSFVLQALAEHGFPEDAYAMLENTEAPGWLAMVRQGATTVWEEYECYDASGSPLPHSMNHYSPGAVCSFLFDTVCGIRLLADQRLELRPVPGGTLTMARGRVQTAWGTVSSSWEKQEDGIHYCFDIPSNVTADVVLPDGRKLALEAGRHRVGPANAESAGGCGKGVQTERNT